MPVTSRLAIVALIALVACTSEDKKLSEGLIGEWAQNTTFESGNVLDETYRFFDNGRFELSINTKTANNANKYQINGKWRVKDRVIYFNVLESTHPKVSVGSTERNEIITMNDEQVVTRGAKGRVTVAHRVR